MAIAAGSPQVGASRGSRSGASCAAVERPCWLSCSAGYLAPRWLSCSAPAILLAPRAPRACATEPIQTQTRRC
eukprot:scaffold43634_cov64-Phaeocystis_antarctica.AAC.7